MTRHVDPRAANLYQIGFAEALITPPMTVPYLSHYPRHGSFEAVHDDLYARAVCISVDDRSVLIVSVDLLGLGRDVVGTAPLALTLREQISVATGISVSAILVCATHAHSTPETSGITRLPASARPWLEQMTASIVAVGIQAATTMEACELRAGNATVAEVAQIRRVRHDPDTGTVPASALDSSVGALVADTATGQRFVALNFACHPVLRQAQPIVSADYPGVVVAQLAASGIRAMFLQGAAGDVNPRRGDSGDFDDVAQDATAVVAGATRAIETAERRPPMVALIAAGRADVALPKRNPPTSLDWAAEHRQDRDPDINRRANDAIRLAEIIGDASTPLTGEVQVLRVGELAVVGIPGEPFTELGLQIKAMSPAQLTFVVGYANDYLGYLAPQSAWVDGGYELDVGPWSLVSGAGANAIVNSATEQLADLWSTPQPLDLPPVTGNHHSPTENTGVTQ